MARLLQGGSPGDPGRTSRRLGVSANQHRSASGLVYRGRFDHPSSWSSPTRSHTTTCSPAGADRRRRTAPAGVPALRRGDEAVRDRADTAGRLTRRSGGRGDPSGRRPGNAVDPAGGHAAGTDRCDPHARPARRAGRRRRGPYGSPVVHLAPFKSTDPAAVWKPGLDALSALTFPRDTPKGPYLGGRRAHPSWRPSVRDASLAGDDRRPCPARPDRRGEHHELLQAADAHVGGEQHGDRPTAPEAAAVAALKANP